MLSSEYIKKIKEDTAFNDFKDYVLAEIEKLDSIDGVDELSNLEAGEEVKARFKAKQILKNILSPFIEFNEKNTPTKEQIKEKESQFGLN